jgi:hypothetical protein
MSVDAAISLLLALMNNAAPISAAIKKARDAGSDQISPDDWAAIVDAADASEARLAKAIQDAG